MVYDMDMVSSWNRRGPGSTRDHGCYLRNTDKVYLILYLPCVFAALNTNRLDCR